MSLAVVAEKVLWVIVPLAGAYAGTIGLRRAVEARKNGEERR